MQRSPDELKLTLRQFYFATFKKCVQRLQLFHHFSQYKPLPKERAAALKLFTKKEIQIDTATETIAGDSVLDILSSVTPTPEPIAQNIKQSWQPKDDASYRPKHIPTPSPSYIAPKVLPTPVNDW